MAGRLQRRQSTKHGKVDLFPYLRYNILTSSKENLQQIHLVDEGIENLLTQKIIV